jgi:hypothetical protein
MESRMISPRAVKSRSSARFERGPMQRNITMKMVVPLVGLHLFAIEPGLGADKKKGLKWVNLPRRARLALHPGPEHHVLNTRAMKRNVGYRWACLATGA